MWRWSYTLVHIHVEEDWMPRSKLTAILNPGRDSNAILSTNNMLKSIWNSYYEYNTPVLTLKQGNKYIYDNTRKIIKHSDHCTVYRTSWQFLHFMNTKLSVRSIGVDDYSISFDTLGAPRYKNCIHTSSCTSSIPFPWTTLSLIYLCKYLFIREKISMNIRRSATLVYTYFYFTLIII